MYQPAQNALTRCHTTAALLTTTANKATTAFPNTQQAACRPADSIPVPDVSPAVLLLPTGIWQHHRNSVDCIFWYQAHPRACSTCAKSIDNGCIETHAPTTQACARVRATTLVCWLRQQCCPPPAKITWRLSTDVLVLLPLLLVVHYEVPQRLMACRTPTCLHTNTNQIR